MGLPDFRKISKRFARVLEKFETSHALAYYLDNYSCTFCKIYRVYAKQIETPHFFCTVKI
jgi:hypothetical protein